jgi:hypothetical protein
MTRAIALSAVLPLLMVAVVFAFAAESSPDLAHPLIQAMVPTLWIGGPLSLAAVILVRRVTAVADGPDFSGRLLSVATSGLPETRRSWGQAMCAELESIEGAASRRRFAWGCSLAAFRAGSTPRQVVVAGATAILIAGGAMAASRFMLAGSRIGLLAYTLLIPPVLLFLSAAGGASPRKSFRDGLLTGILSLVLALIVTIGVELIEAALWYDTAGIFILDGDTPRIGTSRAAVILNPLALHFVLLQSMIWLPMPVLGAALGSRRPREGVRPTFEAQGSTL